MQQKTALDDFPLAFFITIIVKELTATHTHDNSEASININK